MQPIDRPFRFTLDFCVVWAFLAVPTFFLTRRWDVGAWYSCAAVLILLPLFATFVLYGPVLLARQIIRSGSRGWFIARVLLSILVVAFLVFGGLWLSGYYSEGRAHFLAFAYSAFATAYLHWRLRHEQTHQRKWRFLFSGALISLFLITLGYANILGRWGAVGGAFVGLFAILVGVIWCGHLMWILARWTPPPGNKIPPLVWFLGTVLASIIAGTIVSHAGRLVRAHEIQKAVDAGLYKDCQPLLLNWPSKEEMILYYDPVFAKLPASIKMLKPVYVENDNIEDTNLPPNVGICKNGFGGFCMGVRVFRNDQDASIFATNTIGGCERVAPGVYYWWHPT